MINELLQFDRWLFHLINGEWHLPFLDAIAPYWRERKVWFPLYIALAIFAAWRFRWKAVYFIITAALTIAISDQVSSELIKKNVQRLRPCNDPALQDQVQLLISCGSGYSFTSSHAANHFAAAVFLSLTLGLLYPRIRIPLFLWAASIAYAQVYVGVHYPLDVLGGALLGTVIGFLIGKLYLRFDRFKLTA